MFCLLPHLTWLLAWVGWHDHWFLSVCGGGRVCGRCVSRLRRSGIHRVGMWWVKTRVGSVLTCETAVESIWARNNTGCNELRISHRFSENVFGFVLVHSSERLKIELMMRGKKKMKQWRKQTLYNKASQYNIILLTIQTITNHRMTLRQLFLAPHTGRGP